MLELVQAGGWLMLPIILSSIIAAGIVAERLWFLQRDRVIPPTLVAQVRQRIANDQLDGGFVDALRESSPLGRVLAAGLANRDEPREIIKESIEDTGRHVVHELGRYLNSLGTVAGVAPLLGLLGTVVGMINVFAAIMEHGVGNPGVLAGGISQALITTAAGLLVAIPALVGYRYLRGRVEELVVYMEQEAMLLIEVLHRR
ncbi:MAG: MotA/TolQ/ExbB proton channel family protein [Gammaproteobacteria bacterium]